MKNLEENLKQANLYVYIEDVKENLFHFLYSFVEKFD